MSNLITAIRSAMMVRDGKFCVDCKHMFEGPYRGECMCERTRSERVVIDPVSGYRSTVKGCRDCPSTHGTIRCRFERKEER